MHVPGDFYHSTKRATVQPQPSEEYLRDAVRCQRAKGAAHLSGWSGATPTTSEATTAIDS
jgi:hypothetical protein